MNFRKLQMDDAPLMLEWMHNEQVVAYLNANFREKSLEDCQHFIEKSEELAENLHVAITDDKDEYMGTVSLKNIGEGCAEFAITIRECAMGKGYSQFAMSQLLTYGIRELKLEAVYWCVSPANSRAVRFYDKNGYCRTQTVPPHIREHYTQELIWYVYR